MDLFFCRNPGDRHYQHCPNKLDLSTTSQDNLKTVKMKDFIPTSDFLDLLSSYLPNITCILCEYDSMYCDKQTPEHVVVDIRNFKNLKIFYFDLQLLLCKSKSPVCFINFNYIDEDNCYYQLTKVHPIELKPISLEYIQNQPTSSSIIDSITFKCAKIERFILSNEKNDRDVVDINYGGTPNIRTIDFRTDARFRF